MRVTSIVSAVVMVLVACGGKQSSAPSHAASVGRPASSASSASSESAAAARCISVVGWNDLHGQLGPDDPVVDTGRLKTGGVVALADEVAAIRAEGEPTVVLDAGDLFTGPLESTLAEGMPVIDAYRVLAVDAAAVGNHEFDFGPVGSTGALAKRGVGDEAGEAGPRGALLRNMRAASFPFLSANLERKNGKPLDWPNFAKSTVVTRGGFRVGVVGYSTVETPTTTIRPNVEDLEFAAHAAAAVGAEVRALRAAGASPVVLIAHASLEGELPWRLDDPSDPNGDRRVGEMARLLDALGADRPDLIIAGHRHAWALGRVRGVPIVSSSQHGVGLSRSRFCRDSSGAVQLSGIERRVAVAHDPPRSALGRSVAAAVAPWLERVRAEADALVTELPRTCTPQGVIETAYAEQVARAVFEHAGDAQKLPNGVPLVAIVNAGGLRAPLLAGRVRFADLFAAFPFENSVSTCVTTVAGLRRFVDNATHRPSVRERFPFGLYGAHMTFTRRADGQLDLGALALDAKKSPAATTDPVVLALPDFVLWGGDGLLDGVACTETHESATRIREAWRGVLEREHGGCDGVADNVTIR